MKTAKLMMSAITLALLGLNPAIAAEPAKAGTQAKPVATSKADEECPPITEKSTRPRADVKAEGAQAAKSTAGKGEYDCPAPSRASTKKRADVKAEAKTAVKKGDTGGGEADVKK
jgi:hypothetical protein